MQDLDKILDKYPFVQKDNLISILQDIQDDCGYLSEEAIVKVGRYLDMPTSKIYGLASFYHHFRFNPKGKFHIKICNGTSCHANANVLILKEIENKLGIKPNQTTKDGLFSLEETSCLAACGNGPVIQINEEYFADLNVKRVMQIIDSFIKMEE